eukprot:1156566-Pelagomonas_calceolata.AAC.4
MRCVMYEAAGVSLRHGGVEGGEQGVAVASLVFAALRGFVSCWKWATTAALFVCGADGGPLLPRSAHAQWDCDFLDSMKKKAAGLPRLRGHSAMMTACLFLLLQRIPTG